MSIQSPSTSLYEIGRGIAQIAPWDGTTPPTYPTDYFDLGAVDAFEVTVTEELLEHFSKRSGLRVKDKTVVIESGYEFSMTLDEMSAKNLALYLKASIEGNVLHANQLVGQEYALRFDADNPIQGGQKQRWELWRFTLSPDGALALLGDEWKQIGLSGTGLADDANHSTSPLFDVTILTTTTT